MKCRVVALRCDRISMARDANSAPLSRTRSCCSWPSSRSRSSMRRTRDRCVDFECRAFAAAVINNDQYPEARSLGQYVLHEVHRAALTGGLRELSRHYTPHAAAPSLQPSRQLQPLLGVEPLDPLGVHGAAVATEYPRHSRCTERRPLACELGQTRRDRLVLRVWLGAVVPARLRECCQAAGTANAQPVLIDHCFRNSSLRLGLQYFPSMIVFITRMSSDRPATTWFKRRFWSSSCLGRFTSGVPMPPSFDFQRYSAWLLMPH